MVDNWKEEETKPLEECPEKCLKEDEDEEVVLHSGRWWVLASLSVIQFASYGHLIAFGTVTKVTAIYYDQPGDKMDLVILGPIVIRFPTLFLLMATFNRVGLWKTLNLSAFLTAIGDEDVVYLFRLLKVFYSRRNVK